MHTTMPISVKSPQQALALGKQLRTRRNELHLTLQKTKDAIGVDVGQLSRFERGEFRYATYNLQIYADYLRVSLKPSTSNQTALAERFITMIQRSTRHEQAGKALLQALENLQ